MIGPGTGLGVGGLLPVARHLVSDRRARAVTSRWRPTTTVTRRCCARLRRRFGHVSNERVLSGPGLVNLATALAEIDGETLRTRRSA